MHKGASMDGSVISRPAAFLIGEDGRVLWRDLATNYRVRIRPDQILEVIRGAE